MMRGLRTYTLISVVLAALFGAGSISKAFAAPQPKPRTIVVDTHADSTQKITYRGLDAAKPQAMQVDLPKMRAGGLDAQFFSIWVDPSTATPDRYFAEADKQFEAIHQLIRKNPKTIALATTATEVRNNAERGLLSALFGVEGAHALLPGSEADQIAHLRRFHALGARYLTLTWSVSNQLGGSSGDAGAIVGLTDFGRRVIDEMERLGMVVDVSHLSDPMFWDVIRYAKKPVLASHSSARQLANVARNLSDSMLKAIAKNGGAACINFYSRFLDAEFRQATDALWKSVDSLPFLEQEQRLQRELAKFKPVPLGRLVDHIDHVVKVAGIDHVCLGSDFDGIVAVPAGLEDASKLPALVAEIRRRGYSPTDVDKILGGNTLRVLEANPPARR